MEEFKREVKYLVLKWDDINRHLSEEMQIRFHAAITRIRCQRLKECKKDNSYVVVNESETYAELVWYLIKSGHGDHVIIPKGAYEELKRKADWYDGCMDSEVYK